jgi:hypothetical protein
MKPDYLRKNLIISKTMSSSADNLSEDMIMETHDRSIDPDSFRSGHGHPMDWIAKPFSIIFTAGKP